MATCCLCFCWSRCAVHLIALGATLEVAGLLRLSPCTHGLTADADATAAIVAIESQRVFQYLETAGPLSHPHKLGLHIAQNLSSPRVFGAHASHIWLLRMQALDFRLQGIQERHRRIKTVIEVKTNQGISHDVGRRKILFHDKERYLQPFSIAT